MTTDMTSTHGADAPSVPRLLGAWLSELSAIHYKAMGAVGSDIVQKTVTALVTDTKGAFARTQTDVLRMLKKIERDHGTRAAFYPRQRIAAVLADVDRLGGLPARLGADEQAELWLGFWSATHTRFEQIGQRTTDPATASEGH